MGIGLDESTDRSTTKQVVWVVRYIRFTEDLEVRVKTSFLGLKDHPEKCTAQNLKTATENILNEYGVAVQKVSKFFDF